MNRRGFLRGALGAAVGVVASAEIAEALAPKRTIFLPPAGGWDLAYGRDITTITFMPPPNIDVAAGFWLDRYASLDFISRKPFETDAELRARVLNRDGLALRVYG